MKRIWLAIILILTACSSLKDQSSIFNDSSCDPPCWNNITPGVTNKEDMLRILRELPVVDQESITLIGTSWQSFDSGLNFYLYPKRFLGRHSVYADSDLKNDQVVNFGFCGKLGITFEDVISKIGKPESIVTIPSPSGGRFVIAIYQELGIQFSYDTANVPKHLRSEIAPHIKIDCIVYFDPALYEEMLEAGQFSAGHLDAEGTLRIMRPWVGYGSIEKLYRP